MKTKDLVLMAMYVALFAVLEYFSSMVKIVVMPNGGSVTFSAVALILASYHLGYKKALGVVFLGLMVKFMLKAPWFIHPVQFLLDYPLAYAPYALVSLIPSIKVGKLMLPIGTVVADLIRFLIHNLAGWIFYFEGYAGNVFWGVSAYNGTYMIPMLIINLLIVTLILPRIQSRFKKLI